MTDGRFRVAGIIILVGVVQFILLMNIAEFLYPNYSIANNYISDLGVGSVSYIFNNSIIVLGILGMIASYLLFKLDKIFSILLFLSSIGAVGVGVFPENIGALHSISALVVFLFSSIAAIYSYRIERSNTKFIWVILGIISLLSLGLYITKNYMGLGYGGMERMIVYPVLIWLVGISVSIANIQT